VAERQLFKPQTVLLRWRGLRGGGGKSGDSQTLGTGVVLGEPGCAQEKEERETALGLDREKVFSPEKVIKQKTRRSRLPFDDFCLALR
jgi:hypothetical protein